MPFRDAMRRSGHSFWKATIRYHGAADCGSALARSSVRSLLNWLDANGIGDRRREQGQ